MLEQDTTARRPARRRPRWLRPGHLLGGATDHELDGTLPGDELLARADVRTTRGITVDAPPAAVWPWVAQIGQGRGGFYSYDRLENLFGSDIHSADRVLPEQQDLRAGDAVRLAPQVPLTVAVVLAPRVLVLRGSVPMGRVAAPYDFTWTFALQEGEAGSTRLLVRERYAYLAWWAPLVVRPVTLVSLVMTRRMLRGVRDRAGRPERS